MNEINFGVLFLLAAAVVGLLILSWRLFDSKVEPVYPERVDLDTGKTVEHADITEVIQFLKHDAVEAPTVNRVPDFVEPTVVQPEVVAPPVKKAAVSAKKKSVPAAKKPRQSKKKTTKK